MKAIHQNGENTLKTLKIILANIIFLQCIFWVTYEHHILDHFCLFEVYLMKFKLKLLNNLIFFLKIEELECTNYICDKIKPIIKFEKLHMYFKIKFVGEIFG